MVHRDHSCGSVWQVEKQYINYQTGVRDSITCIISIFWKYCCWPTRYPVVAMLLKVAFKRFAQLIMLSWSRSKLHHSVIDSISAFKCQVLARLSYKSEPLYHWSQMDAISSRSFMIYLLSRSMLESSNKSLTLSCMQNVSWSAGMWLPGATNHDFLASFGMNASRLGQIGLKNRQ